MFLAEWVILDAGTIIKGNLGGINVRKFEECANGPQQTYGLGFAGRGLSLGLLVFDRMV